MHWLSSICRLQCLFVHTTTHFREITTWCWRSQCHACSSRRPDIYLKAAHGIITVGEQFGAFLTVLKAPYLLTSSIAFDNECAPTHTAKFTIFETSQSYARKKSRRMQRTLGNKHTYVRLRCTNTQYLQYMLRHNYGTHWFLLYSSETNRQKLIKFGRDVWYTILL